MLHILLARAVLDTSPWRVEVDPDWVVADGVTTVTLWLQSPMQPTAVELRDALDSRLKQNSTLSLSPTEKGRVTPRSARAAAFVNATFGAPNCAETSPSPPPPSPANPPPSLSLPPSLPPSTFDDTAVIDVTVELYDSFSDGWDSLRLVLSTLPGAAMERSFSLAAGPSSARETFSLALGCYSLQLHLNGEPLASTSVGASSSEAAVSEARWRLLGCPVAAPSRLYRAGETAIACVTADEGGGGASCALLAAPAPPPSPPLPSPPPAAPTPLGAPPVATEGPCAPLPPPPGLPYQTPPPFSPPRPSPPLPSPPPPYN